MFDPRCNWAWPVAILAVVTAVPSAAVAAVPVFRDRTPLLPILVAADAAPEERAAADELARVLVAMSGSSAWPVRAEAPGEKGIRIGRTHTAAQDAAPLRPAADPLAPVAGEIGPDGFRIRAGDGGVTIEGATPEAAEYAVAWLLQTEAGVRWYAPGPEGEVIPARREWALRDFETVRQPAYLSREIYPLDTPEEKAWGRHNGLRGRLEFSHALNRVFLPGAFETHPEWASLVRGRRDLPVSPDDYNWQPNLALPAVAEAAARSALAAFAREPGRLSFSLAMNDTVRFDQGPETRALVEPLKYFRGMPDYSPLLFTFMNRAAATVEQDVPGHYLGCLAYFWGENPPPFPVHPAVIPYLTTDRTQYYDSAYRDADLALMSRWGRSGVRAFGLWEYAEGGNFLVPRVPHAALAEAVREGWRRGARGYFAEMGAQWGFDAFKAWLLAQLLWDPERPLAELKDDFFRGYYGGAAEAMRRFFDRCEAQWLAQSGPPAWLKFYRQQDQALLFPPEVCRELRGILTEASREADSPAIAARVALTSRAFAVTEAYVGFDAARREIVALAGNGTDELSSAQLASAGEKIRQLGEARAGFEAALAAARTGRLPALARTETAPFFRDDPVPRLLWRAGASDASAPRRMLAAAGPAAERHASWRALAEALAEKRIGPARNLAANSGFQKTAAEKQDPPFLFPRFGDLPADWRVQAMPTEAGRVDLVQIEGPDARRRAVRIEGAWDTQVFQWLPAEPGRTYVATARLRGKASPGDDSSLFLSFLTTERRPVGNQDMQRLPLGATDRWLTAALAEVAPANAAWVGLGVGSAHQSAGDWIELTEVELRGVRGEPASP